MDTNLHVLQSMPLQSENAFYYGYAARAACAYQNGNRSQIYFIGRRVDAISSRHLGTEIRVADALAGSQVIATSLAFAGLDTNLLAGDVGLFKVQTGGKMLVGGLLNLNGQKRQALVRLLPDGSLDPSFAIRQPPAKYVRWYVDTTGILREGHVDTLTREAVWGNVSMSTGTFSQAARSAWNPLLPLGRPCMYHPGYGAFLFESGALQVPDPLGQSVIAQDMDSGVICRYRFWVDAQGLQTPLSPRYGLDIDPLSGALLKTLLNANAKQNRLVVQGPFTTVNNRLRPRMAVLYPDGQIDSTYANLLALPAGLRQRYLNLHPDAHDTYLTPTYIYEYASNEQYLFTAGAGGRLIATPDMGRY